MGRVEKSPPSKGCRGAVEDSAPHRPLCATTLQVKACTRPSITSRHSHSLTPLTTRRCHPTLYGPCTTIDVDPRLLPPVQDALQPKKMTTSCILLVVGTLVVSAAAEYVRPPPGRVILTEHTKAASHPQQVLKCNALHGRHCCTREFMHNAIFCSSA